MHEMLLKHVYKLIEQISAVVRARRCFGVVLHRKEWFILYPYAFNGIIVEVQMGNLNIIGIMDCLRVHSKTMVLGSYFATARNYVFDRMIKPTVAMVHFKGWYAMGKCKQLMAKTNAKHWFVMCSKLLYSFNGIRHSGRVAGAIAYKKAIRLKIEQVLHGGFSRKYFGIHPTVNQVLQDILLNAKIEYSNPFATGWAALVVWGCGAYCRSQF